MHLFPACRNRRTGRPRERTPPRSAGLGSPQGGDELRPGACHPGADRAHRAATHPRRLGVGETEHLGEHEGLPPVGLQAGAQVGDLGGRPRHHGGLPTRPPQRPCRPVRTAEVVGAHPAGDTQEPAGERRLTPERAQRAQGPQIGLLGEVVGCLGRHEVPAEAPHLCLGLANETGEGDIVSLGGCVGQFGERVGHRHSLDAERVIGQTGNRGHDRGDVDGMDCDRAREAISAALDGEASPVADAEVQRHLRDCPDCAAFAATAAAQHRRMRVGPAEPVPDLHGRVVAAARRADRSGPRRLLRLALAAVATTEATLALAELTGEGATPHATRHLGAFSVAVAIGLFVVVVRPARARAFLALTATLAGAVVVGAVVDLARGATPALAETRHVVEVAAFVVVWLLARDGPLPQPDRDDDQPALRVVGEPDPPRRAAGQGNAG